MRKTDIAPGARFGRWTVIKENGRSKKGEKMYDCICDCGVTKTVSSSNLRYGTSRSCGCLARELTSQRSKTHGMSDTRLFNIWRGMRTRCYSKSDYHYKWYGARGITVCDDWKNDFHSFYDWAMENGYQDGLSIDRIDNNGDYCSENCHWITQHEQTYNTRKNVYLTYNGETKCVSEWSDIIGISNGTLYHRIKCGWSDEKILTTPVTVPETQQIMLEIDGQRRSIQEWSKISGVSTQNIKHRLNVGLDPRVAVFEPAGSHIVHRRSDEDIEILEYSAKYGISTDLIRLRMKNGMPIEIAGSKPVRGTNGACPFGINELLTIGSETHTLSEWAERNGIKWDTAYCRMKHGIPVEIAVTKPTKTQVHVKTISQEEKE